MEKEKQKHYIEIGNPFALAWKHSEKPVILILHEGKLFILPLQQLRLSKSVRPLRHWYLYGNPAAGNSAPVVFK
jgi:hypothetical protein